MKNYDWFDLLHTILVLIQVSPPFLEIVNGFFSTSSCTVKQFCGSLLFDSMASSKATVLCRW